MKHHLSISEICVLVLAQKITTLKTCCHLPQMTTRFLCTTSADDTRRYNVFFAQTHSWCPIIGKTYTVVIFSHLWWIHISHRTQAFWATICCLIDVLWVMNHVAMIFIAQIPKRKVNINSTAQTLWIPVLFSIQDFTYMPL